ncbi:hypothetical protein H6P81_021212 [Aristolochia fimbriata]|uniref:Uncharacterized protein n=1 Tax=Aristolochia fimbriata TaxID=158543 RepID=A0AAV7DU48_ARIFI|nr:hypothetical protein H6P81_021212 [Aristolochia fimbriata]
MSHRFVPPPLPCPPRSVLNTSRKTKTLSGGFPPFGRQSQFRLTPGNLRDSRAQRIVPSTGRPWGQRGGGGAGWRPPEAGRPYSAAPEARGHSRHAPRKRRQALRWRQRQKGPSGGEGPEVGTDCGGRGRARCEPQTRGGGLLPPARSVQWLAPQRVSSAKAICPSLPLGDGLQLFSRAGKGPSGPRDPFAQLEFFDLSRSLRDRSVPPLPILTCLCGAYGAFAASPCGRGIGRADRRRVRVVHVGHARVVLPARMSRRLVAPSSLHCTDLPRPCWVAGIPLQSESDRPTFAFDRRCPWPGAGAFRIGGVLASRSLRGCYLVDPASSHMLVSKIKPCMWAYHGIGGWRRIRVRFGREPESGYHIKKGRQQARKLPNRHGELKARSWTLGWVVRSPRGVHRSTSSLLRRCAPGLNWRVVPRWWWAICLVNSVSERDLSLLTSYVEVTLHGQLLRGTMAFRPRKFEAITGEPAEGSLSIPAKRARPSERAAPRCPAAAAGGERKRPSNPSPGVSDPAPGGLSVSDPADGRGRTRTTTRAICAKKRKRSKLGGPTSNTNPANHRVFERKLHPRPLGQGGTPAWASRPACSPHPVPCCPPRAVRWSSSSGGEQVVVLAPLARLAEKHFAPRAPGRDSGGSALPGPAWLEVVSRPWLALKGPLPGSCLRDPEALLGCDPRSGGNTR